ncbi:ABC transporter transmembrane domain-containing protein [Synechococcus sp. PCC 7336]|uniref:ABC transporter transmembrane domain-containing protein n=1 Tax=Synechococcus sp. PCC 7336 TaxID=195250 RepID=UPI00034D477A|nr:peptidase domain-containing ABC transporter [Synechococcus sp. PCC 7336]
MNPGTHLKPVIFFEKFDSLTISKISARLDTQDFELGEQIFASSSSPGDEGELSSDRPPDSLYLVCEGRVRLLCQQSDRQREATAAVLESGTTFGGDRLFCATLIPHRAIAASKCRVVRIPMAQLDRLQEQFPQLQKGLPYQAKQLERLLFLKSLSNLQSIPSKKLQALANLLAEGQIEAGRTLAEVAPASEGRYWLRKGQLGSLSPNSPSELPSVGESWGFPNTAPADWIARTDLFIYKLSKEHWGALTTAIPALANVSSKPVGELRQRNGSSSSPSGALAVSKSSSSSSTAIARTHSQEIATEPTPPSHQPEPIIFPKPANRRVLDFLERFPFIQQQSSSDCGVACLAMVSLYWGKRFPLYVLRERANVGLAGASLSSLAKAAEGIGFNARPIRASLNRLVDLENPWIAHWEGNHFVVVYRIRGNSVTIADPALGRKVLSLQEFEAGWTGYALLLDPTNRLKDTEIKQSSLWKFASSLAPFRNVIAQVLVASILIQIFALCTPLFTQVILDKVVVQKSQVTLNVFVLGLFIFGLTNIALTASRKYLMSYFSNHLNLTLIGAFINHTLRLPLKFFESRRVGDILTRVSENNKIQRFLIQQVVLAWLGFLTGFVYMGLMLYYNTQLTLLVMAMIPIIAIVTLAATPFLRRISREIFKEAADQNSALVEMMTGVSTIKAAAAEREMRWRWEDRFTRLLNARFKGQKFGIALSTIGGTINSIGSTALLWYGATLVIQDQLTIGQFVAFNMMIGRVISPALALSSLWDELQEVTISVERLNDVFETEPEEKPQHQMQVMPQIKGDVRFEDITFRYGEDEERNTLQNISFSAQTGQTIAIVGRSGSGKTTLVKLLQRMYQPNTGRILIDDHDIRHVSPYSLRSQFGVVPQDCFLFSGTISENITLFRPEFSLEQVVEVAKLAEAHAFIQALPLGYNTKVGERGATLSGGQRQRIAIARALLGDPRILVLDEATSSLDTESERRFQENLSHISRDRTTFIIAHRLSTVRNADCILVIDRGILVERGNHDELIAQKGLYYQLAQQQLDL